MSVGIAAIGRYFVVVAVVLVPVLVLVLLRVLLRVLVHVVVVYFGCGVGGGWPYCSWRQ